MSDSRPMVRASRFIPTAEGMEFLWGKFDENRAAFDDSLCKTPFEFTCWVAGQDTVVYTIGGTEADPHGVILFADIKPHYNAFGHILIWDTVTTDLVARANTIRAVALAVMRSNDLPRLTVTIPVTNRAAIAFSSILGFKREGVLRKGARVDDELTDVVLLGMTEEDAREADERATLNIRGQEGE